MARVTESGEVDLHPVPGYGVTVTCMTEMFMDQVPDACTLPTVERPLRVAEFGRLFSSALQSQARVSATRLRWVLDAAAEPDARDLMARESQCCSFFTFTISSSEDGDTGQVVVVDVDVPAEQEAVLDALQTLAARAARTAA